MAMHKIFSDLMNSVEMPTAGKMFKAQDTDAYYFAWGVTVPANGAVGYAYGCIFIHTDGTNQTNCLYANIGTAASANFNAITIAAD